MSKVASFFLNKFLVFIILTRNGIDRCGFLERIELNVNVFTIKDKQNMIGPKFPSRTSISGQYSRIDAE